MSRVGPEWIDSTGFSQSHVLVPDGFGGSEFKLASTVPGARNLPLTATFFDSAKPYLETNALTWTTIADFIFDGTDTFTVARMKVIGSASAPGSTHMMRFYDIVNLVQVCSVSWTSDTKGIYNAAIDPLNLPAGQAIFEIQVMKTGGAKTRVHYVAME